MGLKRVREESFALRRLARRAGRTGGPAIVSEVPERPVGVKLEMTYACNLRCGFCYTDSPRHTVAGTPEMSDEEYRDVTCQVIDLGVIEAVVTGGEPLLRRELTLETLARLGDAGVGVTLNTNGWFVDNEVAARMAEVRGLHVHVSVDGATPSVHDASRGMPGSWRRVIEAVHLMLEHGVAVQAVYVLTPENEHELDDFLEQMWVLGMPYLRVTPVLPIGNAARGGEWAVDRTRMRRTIEAFLERRSGMVVRPQSATGQRLAVRDAVPPGSLLVRPDGRVRIDSVTPFAFGHALDEGLAACWERIRERWLDPSIENWVDSIGSTPGLPSADVVPYLDDEVEVGGPAPSGEERRAAVELPVAKRVAPPPADPATELAEARERVRELALSRRYKLGPVRSTGGPVHRFVRRTDVGTVTRLNASASIVLDALAGRTPGDAVGAVSARHPEVDRARVEDDVLGIVRTLTERGLVVPAMAHAPAGAFVESTPDLPDMTPGATV